MKIKLTPGAWIFFLMLIISLIVVICFAWEVI